MTDLRSRLTTALADEYAIERELGHGGMAVVYLARDVKHDRPVAIKVLRPELAASLGAERFLREIQISAQLNHPNILTLIDSGSTEQRQGDSPALLYYVMPFVDGESLRDRLDREKQLPIDDALQITKEVADALGYAHSLGFVHRDIKPENILFGAGHALVSDFGIARAVSEAGGTSLTETGLAVGTPAYMSPEQCTGGRDVDARSDIYSLGCVLYEMLGGDPPFTGSTPQVVIARKTTESAPALRSFRRTTPEGIEAAVAKALETVPADRYTTTEQFVTDLDASVRMSERVSRYEREQPRWNRWVPYVLGAAAAAVLLVAAFIAGVPQRILAPGAGSDTIRSVAVLPFDNLGGGEEREAFIAGLHHDLLTHLHMIEGLSVRSRTTVMSYLDRGLSIEEIGRALRVDAVMEGGVQWADGTLRVNAQLIDVETDDHLWADQFDHETTTDLLTTQTAIVRRIAQELGVRLSSETDARVARRPTENDAAYDLYLRAYPLVAEFRDLEQARGYVNRAIVLDSTFALAYALLARLTLLNWRELTQAGAQDSALVLARRSVELDPDVGATHGALGLVLDARLEFEAAAVTYGRAIELSPSDAFAHLTLGEMNTTLGRLDEALDLLRRAQALDPSLRPIGYRLAEVLFERRAYDEAIEVANTYLALYPDFAGAGSITRLRGWCYVASGTYQEAIGNDQEYQRRVDSDSTSAEYLRRLSPCGPTCVMALAGMGDTTAARAGLAVLESEGRAGVRGRGARVYAALGEEDRAFEMLDWTVEFGYWRDLRLLTHPFWDPLRVDQRFDALLRRTGLR